MRVMVLGDTHADSTWCREVTRIAGAQGVERILQVGDFGYWPRVEHVEHGAIISLGRRFLAQISEACAKAGVHEWIVIDGNHDDHKSLHALTDPDSDGLLRLGPHVRYSPRGNSFTLGGTVFGTLGGAASIDAHLMADGVPLGDGGAYQPGWDWFPDLESPTLDDVDRLPSNVDVLLTHEAPIEVDLSHFNGFPGIRISPEIQQVCDAARHVVSAAVAKTSPKLVVHGHWHGRNRVSLQELGCEIVGLAANLRRTGRNKRSFLVLDLPDLTVKTVKSSL